MVRYTYFYRDWQTMHSGVDSPLQDDLQLTVLVALSALKKQGQVILHAVDDSGRQTSLFMRAIDGDLAISCTGDCAFRSQVWQGAWYKLSAILDQVMDSPQSDKSAFDALYDSPQFWWLQDRIETVAHRFQRWQGPGGRGRIDEPVWVNVGEPFNPNSYVSVDSKEIVLIGGEL